MGGVNRIGDDLEDVRGEREYRGEKRGERREKK